MKEITAIIRMNKVQKTKDALLGVRLSLIYRKKGDGPREAKRALL